MESVHLKTLVGVVKAGSISNAAATLCVTQPTVSRRIKAGITVICLSFSVF